MNILVVCSIVPFPETRGDPVRVMRILERLSQQASVKLCVVNSNDGDEVGLKRALTSAQVEVFASAPSPWTRRFGPIVRNSRAVLRSKPAWVEARASPDLCAYLSSVEAAQFDAIVVLGEAAAQYLEGSSLRWHWDKVNVLAESQRLARHEAVGAREAIAARVNSIAGPRYEARLLKSASSLSVTNEEEQQRLRQHYGREAEVILRSEVAIPADVERHPLCNKAIWLGNLTYKSNLGGLRAFLTYDWPALHREGWTLDVVGSGMSEALRSELSRFSGVNARGFVDDLSTEFSRAALGVVPLWSGGGTKIKTLTMMANSLPVVTTESGAEGIPRHYLKARAMVVVDGPGSFVPAVTGLHRMTLEEIGANGRRLIEAEFSGSAIGKQVTDLLQTAAGQM